MIPLATLLLVASVGVVDDAQPEPSPREQLHAFGGGLKAAVQSGVMSREEAWSLWEAASLVYRMEHADDGKARETSKEDSGNVEATAWYRARRLTPPRARTIEQAIEPEFLTRDALLLESLLDLEDEQMVIVYMVLQDYADTFEQLTAPLKDALTRWREAERARDLQAAMQRLDGSFDLGGVDLDAAARTFLKQDSGRSAGKGSGGGNDALAPQKAADSANQQKAQAAEDKRAQQRERQAIGLQTMNEQLASLRERMQGRLAVIESAGELVDSADVHRLLQQVAAQRALLRADVEEMLGTIVVFNDDRVQAATLKEALARLDLSRPATQARYGGEHIPLEQVIAQVMETAPGQVTDALDSTLLERAALSRARAQAAIDRELEGWRFMIEREDIMGVHRDDDSVELEVWVEALSAYGQAWRRQLATSLQIRDRTLEQVDLIEALLEAVDQAQAQQWHTAAMQRGFALEMRPRWVERALDAALGLADLEIEQVEALLLLQSHVLEELAAIRARAIERRIERDPQVTASPMESFWGDRRKVERPWTKEDWAGFEHEAHDALADRTASDLAAILTTEQLGRLPARRGNRGGEAAAKGNPSGKSSGKSSGKNTGKSPGKSSGNGQSKSSGNGQGKRSAGRSGKGS